MGWVFLEVLAALALAVGIVWWTMPRKPGVVEERAGKKEAAQKAAEKETPPPG